MADYGTIILAPTETTFEIIAYQPSGGGIAYGAVQAASIENLSTISAYYVSGTIQPPSTVPTTGQIWPRGNK